MKFDVKNAEFARIRSRMIAVPIFMSCDRLRVLLVEFLLYPAKRSKDKKKMELMNSIARIEMVEEGATELYPR
jgi:hypothetical protein